MMQLYYCDVLAGRKACAGARYLKAPVEFVYVDLGKGEQAAPAYLALNPNGKVPTLVDGERVFWEADAILCHLSDQMGATLWPRDVQRQIEAVRWMSWSAQHFTRTAGALYFEHVIKARFDLGPPDPAETDPAQTEFRRLAAILDAHLKGREWLVDGGPTTADFAVGATLPYAQTAQLPIADFPNLCRWNDRLNDIEAWREPYPKR